MMHKPAVFLVGILLFASCSRSIAPKENKTFQTYPYTSRLYQSELIAIIKGNEQKHLQYFFKDYHNDNGVEFLEIEVVGDEFYALGQLFVTNWKKLENIRKTKGESYKGAQLIGLKYEIQMDSLKNERLVYTDLEKLSD